MRAKLISAARSHAAIQPMLLGLPFALLLSACERKDPAPSPADTGTETGATAPAITVQIPSAIQGRWALRDSDCATGAVQPTGLIKVTPTTVEFYESVAELGEVSQSSPRAIRSVFAFTGEGVSWERDQSLELLGDGDRLERREYGIDAPTEAFTYTKCPQGE